MKTASRSKPVMIRYEGKGKGREWHLSDLVAIFPAEPGGNAASMMCYSTVGGHSTCDAAYIKKTKPATKEQGAAMLEALRSRGFGSLRVVSRISPAHRASRASATWAMNSHWS